MKRVKITLKSLKRKGMLRPGLKSLYARKFAYLASHGGWGFQYDDKPWK